MENNDVDTVTLQVRRPDGKCSKPVTFKCCAENCHLCKSIYGGCPKDEVHGVVFGG